MDYVDQIKTRLTDERKNFTVEVYPEATDGFFCDERPSYHDASAKDAWGRTKAFFAQQLK
jgi:carboxymethylenebutenolidase